MSKRASFYEAYSSPEGRLRLVDDLEPHFAGCSPGVRARITALQFRITHDDPRVWKPALDEIAKRVSDA